jgi:hypothetical protein
MQREVILAHVGKYKAGKTIIDKEIPNLRKDISELNTKFS